MFLFKINLQRVPVVMFLITAALLYKWLNPSGHILTVAVLMDINPLNAELNPICCLLALLGAHHFLHVSRIRVKSLTLRLLMSYIYMTLIA